jgi:hypothetical protein
MKELHFYLKSLLSCVDENGLRENGNSFLLAESGKNQTHKDGPSRGSAEPFFHTIKNARI